MTTDSPGVRAELRAHTQALNALRETQREMGQQIRALDHRMDDGFAATGAGFLAAEAQFATVKDGIDEIAALLKGRGEPE